MGSSSASHIHVCPPTMSKALALGFLTTKKPFALVSAFVPKTLLQHRGWPEASVLPSKCHKCSGSKGTVSESHWSVWGSRSWGLWGLVRYQENPECSEDTKLGKYFGILTSGDIQHLFCGLEKMQKAPCAMVTYFAEDYLTAEEAEPGYEEHRPQNQAD